jgi:ubiquinone biosynthesis protein UbiJ
VKDPASALGESLANRLIRDEDWAREKLAAHGGRSFVVRSGPLSTAYAIRPDGEIEAREALVSAADVEVSISPLDVPALLADPLRWDKLVTSTGDPALAATLRDLATTLPWFVERGFATAFGPVVGQRLADAGRALLGFPQYANSRVAENLASYARDEVGLLARGDDARGFAGAAAELATRVDALGARIDRIGTGSRG